VDESEGSVDEVTVNASPTVASSGDGTRMDTSSDRITVVGVAVEGSPAEAGAGRTVAAMVRQRDIRIMKWVVAL
jgi:hypothetical protein